MPISRVTLRVVLLFGCLFLATVLVSSWIAANKAVAQESSGLSRQTEQSADYQGIRRQTLEKSQTAMERARQELQALQTTLQERLKNLQIGQITETMVEQARVDTRSAQLQREELQAEIANTQTSIEDLQQSIQTLEAQEQLLQNPGKDATEEALRQKKLQDIRQNLAEQRGALKVEEQLLAAMQNWLEFSTQRLALTTQWQSQLEELYRFQQEQNRQEAQVEQKKQLQEQLQTQMERVGELTQRLQAQGENLSQAEQQELEARIQDAKEQASLVWSDIKLAEIDTKLANLQDLPTRFGVDPEVLKEGLEQLKNLKNELQVSRNLLQRKIALYEEQREITQQRNPQTPQAIRLRQKEINLISQLLEDLKKRREQMQSQLATIDILQQRLSKAYTNALSEDLLTRKKLPRSSEAWQQFLTDVKDTPKSLLHQMQLSVISAVESIKNSEVPYRVGLGVVEFGLLILLLVAWRGLQQIIAHLRVQDEVSFSGRVALILSKLFAKNVWGIGLITVLLVALWILEVPQPGFGIIITLVSFGIGIKIAINLTWLLMASPDLPPEDRSPKLYRQWVITLVCGGILAAITILTHLSALSEAVIGLLDRLFMLYVLLISVPVLRGRRFYVDLLAPHYGENYWFVSLRLLSLLLPMSLVGAAIVGLAGYLNLAWTVAWHLAIFVLVLAGLLVLRGMLKDMVVWLKNYAVTHSQYGLLWTQEVITPLETGLRVLLLFGAFVVLFSIYGWDLVADFFELNGSTLLVAVGLALVVYEVIFILASYAVERTRSAFGGALIRHTRQPISLILPVAAAQLVASHLSLSDEFLSSFRHALAIGQIIAVSWLIVRLVSAIEEVMGQRYRLDAKDNLAARRVQTQVKMLRRIISITVYIVAISAIMMTFPRIRQFGAGLLASAGVAGLVIGVAARPLMENLIAGVLIGLTQPIRLDDVVIVEGEWGRIAEINSTHVIVHLWDDRRLVVPLNYFNTQPFQNWTRTGGELLGTAFFHVDYTFPVEEGRQMLKRILDESDLWDGRAWGLQVTDSKEQTLELRALMSAPDASTAWDLRCYVREKFVAFLQQSYPECLPKTRAVLGDRDKKEAILKDFKAIEQAL